MQLRHKDIGRQHRDDFVRASSHELYMYDVQTSKPVENLIEKNYIILEW